MPPLPANPPTRINLTPAAQELFNRLMAQLGPHEELHFGPIYELALELFLHVYGRVPADIPRFQELRKITESGGKLPLFD